MKALLLSDTRVSVLLWHPLTASMHDVEIKVVCCCSFSQVFFLQRNAVVHSVHAVATRCHHCNFAAQLFC